MAIPVYHPRFRSRLRRTHPKHLPHSLYPETFVLSREINGSAIYSHSLTSSWCILHALTLYRIGSMNTWPLLLDWALILLLPIWLAIVTSSCTAVCIFQIQSFQSDWFGFVCVPLNKTFNINSGRFFDLFSSFHLFPHFFKAITRT